MNIPRWNHGMIILDGMPTVFGGDIGLNNITSSGERFNGTQWIIIDNILETPRYTKGNYVGIPDGLLDCAPTTSTLMTTTLTTIHGTLPAVNRLPVEARR